MKFSIINKDSETSARAGELVTAHGTIKTPIFMPVGTQASVKAISPADLNDLAAQIILGNTYHLYLRPGTEIVAKAGGIQKFSSWHGPVLTDSGGYQVFSLSELNKIKKEGLHFQSHLDGSRHFFSPENVIEHQRQIGPDIMMVLDECVPYPAEFHYVKKSIAITIDWARRSMTAFKDTSPRHGYNQTVFAIVQGGTYADLRRDCTHALVDLDFPGYAIGGLSVGEPKDDMYNMTAVCTDILPQEKPRYLMGVGKPEDLLQCVERGIDMFDCILPTRNGRNGAVFTSQGQLSIKNARFKEDFGPLCPDCACYTCQNFSRAYLRHLFIAHELLVLKLLSFHNIWFYLRLMESIRKNILQNNFSTFKKEFLYKYNKTEQTSNEE